MSVSPLQGRQECLPHRFSKPCPHGLMLAALSILGLTDIHQMNGLKNFLAFSINATAAVYFAVSGAVLWSDGLPMAASAVCGGLAGAAIARKIGRQTVRRVVVGIGLLMAISLFLRQIW